MKRRITDEDLDRLIRAQPRHVPADLAHRLAQRLAAEPRRNRQPRRWWWAALPLAAAAGFALWFRPATHPTPDIEDIETLFALDDSLTPGTALLDPINRELCAQLPIDSLNLPMEDQP